MPASLQTGRLEYLEMFHSQGGIKGFNCGLTVLGSALGGAGSPLQAAHAPRLLLAPRPVQHMQEIALVWPAVRNGHHLQGRGKPPRYTWPWGFGGLSRSWGAERLLVPLLCCRPKGISSGGVCGISGISFGSSFSLGKSCWVFLGPSYLVAPFCILLRRLKCAPLQALLNRLCFWHNSDLVSYCITSWAVKLMQCELQMLFPHGLPWLLNLFTFCT